MTLSIIISLILWLLIPGNKSQESLNYFFTSPIVEVEFVGENLSCFNHQLFRNKYTRDEDSILLKRLSKCLYQAISTDRDITSIHFSEEDIDSFKAASAPYLKDFIGQDLPKERFIEVLGIIEDLEKEFGENPQTLLESYKNSNFETFEIYVMKSKRIDLSNARGEKLILESTHNLIRKPFDLPWTAIYNYDTIKTFNLNISACLQESTNINMFHYNSDKVALMLEILETELSKE